MTLGLILGNTINFVLADIALALFVHSFWPDRRQSKRAKKKAPTTTNAPAWLSIIGLAGFALLFVAIGWLGCSAPMAVWTRLGAPAGHGFSVGALGICGALLFGGAAVHGIGVRWMHRGANKSPKGTNQTGRKGTG